MSTIFIDFKKEQTHAYRTKRCGPQGPRLFFTDSQDKKHSIPPMFGNWKMFANGHFYSHKRPDLQQFAYHVVHNLSTDLMKEPMYTRDEIQNWLGERLNWVLISQLLTNHGYVGCKPIAFFEECVNQIHKIVRSHDAGLEFVRFEELK